MEDDKELEIRKYMINGRVYTFTVDKMDGGVPYGYCKRTKKWAWLFSDYIHDEDGRVVDAELIQ